MRGILIDPGAEPVICRLPDTLEGLQGLAGGFLQARRFGSCFAQLLFVPQRGDAMPCRRYAGQWYYGRLFLVGCRRGNLTDLPQELARQLAETWKNWEVPKC